MAYPTKFNKETRRICRMLYEKGFLDREVADVMGVSWRTIMSWREKNPEFFAEVMAAKDKVDDKAERTLFERAMGYKVKETKVTMDGQGAVLERTVTQKEIPPDVGSLVFWLKNRRRDQWKDRWDISADDGVVNVNILSFRDSQKVLKPAKPPLKLVDGKKKVKDAG